MHADREDLHRVLWLLFRARLGRRRRGELHVYLDCPGKWPGEIHLNKKTDGEPITTTRSQK